MANAYRDFYAFLRLLTANGVQGFTNNQSVKRYDYSDQGFWVVRYRHFRVFCTIHAKIGGDDVLVVHEVLDKNVD